MKPAAYQLGLALLLLCSTAQAQQPQRPSDAKLNAMVQTLEGQRNAAQNQIVNLVGELTDRDERIAALEKARQEAEAKLMACKPEK